MSPHISTSFTETTEDFNQNVSKGKPRERKREKLTMEEEGREGGIDKGREGWGRGGGVCVKREFELRDRGRTVIP